MKLRLPLLLRLALLSTAAAYTLGSGCLLADDAPTDAAQDDPIAEAVDEEESDSPAIGFEGYTESQLVDIQSSESAGAVIRQMLENSTTGAVANVGTSASTSNGATTAASESPALTLSAPAEPVADTTLTTSTLSDSAGEGAVAPFFSAEEAAALVVATPATSTPSVKNASTATLSSSDSPDETTSSATANGASSSIASVGSASAAGSGASSGGGSASYTLTSSAPDSSSSLVITTPTDDTSSDPIAEDVLEDSTIEDTTTSTTLPDSSASTLATTTSTSATTRTLPQMKLLGSTEATTVTISDAQIWDEDSEIPTAGSNVNVGGASASLEINTSGVELGLLRLYNGGDVTVDSGSEVNITQVRVHDSWSTENEVLRVSGVLNISHENSDKAYNNAALLIGHWSAGSGAVEVLSGGKLNVLSGWTHVSKDSDGFLAVRNGAVANLRGIVYYNSSAHDATVTIDVGGRINVGEYGVYDNSGASSHTLCLNGGTLGVLSADGANGNIVWEDCGRGPRVSVTENSVLDTAVVTSAGIATGGVGTMKFGTVAVSDGKVLTVQGGGRVMVTELQLTKDSSLNFIDSTGFEGRVNLQISIGELSTVKHVNASGVEVAEGENYYTWGTFAKSTDFLNGLADSSSVTYVWNGTGEVERQSVDGQYVYNVFDKDYVIVNASKPIDTNRTKSSVTLAEGAGELTMTSVSQFNLAPITVCKNSTLNIHGNVDQCFSVILNGGVLKNDTGSCGEEHMQINALSLTADSKLQVDSTFGLISSVWGANTLDLGGCTLTKAGTEEYLAISTALRGGGTLKITQGKFNLKSRDNKPAATLGAVGDDADTNIWLTAGELTGSFIMNRASEFRMDDENTSASGSASITAIITNVDKTATFRVASDDVLTFSGSMKGNDTSSGSLTKTEEGRLLMSGQENKIANLTVQGGEVEISGAATFTGALTLSGSGVAKNTGTVTLNSSSGNKSFLTQMTGNGDIVLATNTTLTNTDSSHVTGKLTINSGVTLTLGTGDRQTVAIDSFSSIDLAGSIKAQNSSETLKNLSVASGAEGAVFSKDMGSSDDDCLMTFAGTTKVDGTLRIGNHWNAQFKIDKLTGNGSLLILSRDVNDTIWETSSQEAASYTLSDVSNFGGSVTVNNSKATVDIILGGGGEIDASRFTKTSGTLNLIVNKSTTLIGDVSGINVKVNSGGVELVGTDSLDSLTVAASLAKITGNTSVSGTGISLALGSKESPVGLDISGTGRLTYDSVTYQALSGQTAEIRRMGTEEGNFSLSNSSYSISGAALKIGGTSTKVKVHTKLDGVTLSSTGTVQLGCSEASLSGISVSELHVGYWDDNNNTKSNVTAILTGEGQVSGDMKVIMTSALTVSGALDVSGAVSSGAGSSIKIGNVDDILCSLGKSAGTGDMIIDGGVNIKYDSANDKAVIAGAGSDQIATLENAAVNLNSGGTLEVSNIGLSDGSALFVKSEGATATTITNQTDSTAKITGSLSMKYQVAQDTTPAKAIISGAGIDSPATISNAVIDVAAGSKLELSNVVLAESTWLHDEETTGDGGSTSPYTGSVDLNGVEGKVTGTGEDGGTLQAGTVLTKTGTTGSGEGAILTLQSDAKVFKIAYSQITQMASIGGTGLTLDFNSYDGGKGFASLYETLNGKYDYVAIEFASTVGEINFSTLVVNAKITNGDGVTGKTTGYYVGDTAVVNATSSSGVVVYFDAIALPEPTTSTLGLLALAALCARRRRSRTRAHAEHA